MNAIDKSILTNVRCCKCGLASGACDCWERCSCGYFAEKGKPCRNPNTQRCSTKLKYGKKKKRGTK